MKKCHHILHDLFMTYFPNLPIRSWWSKGDYAIRVRCVAFPEDLVFTWGDVDNWSLMPVSVHDELIAQNQAKKA